MKRIIKNLELIGLILMLSFSMTACGEKEEKETAKISKEDNAEVEDEEDEKKSSKKDKADNVAATPQPTIVPTAEPTAEPQEDTRKYDEEALELLEESWDVLNEFVENTKQEDLEKAKNILDNISLRKCSEEVKRLVEEDKLIIKDLELVYDWSRTMIQFGEEFSQIDFSNMDMMNITNVEEIEKLYTRVSGIIETCKALEIPQIMEHDIKREIELLERYQALLVELYLAEQNQDVLAATSAYCFYDDWKTEQEDLLGDIETIATELETHTNVYLKRFEQLGKEFLYNLEAIYEEDYEDVDFSYLDAIENTKVTASISCIDTIYPAMYNRLQAVSIVNLSYVNGEKDVLITVEVEGFSQKFEKTVTINQFPQRYYVKPPVITSGLNLNNQKNTQIKVTVTDVDTGKIIASETENVKIMSINDFILSSNEYGYTNYADVLAWVTPESDYIQELLRIAADNMEEYTGYNGIAGYQKVVAEEEKMITAYQVYAIQKAISDIGVRYVRSSYSIGEATNATQRVNRPDETLLSKSGICIETSVLMASALQAAGIDSMIVLTTGHCQVAVETWEDSGEYLLIETTTLPVEGPYDSADGNIYINKVIRILKDDEWLEYLKQRNGIIYSCDLATDMGIIPLVYE